MAENYPIKLDLNGIKKILPHLEPFLFLDGGEILGAVTARGRITFPRHWDIFNGHFPNKPLVPGVILQEVLGQTASLVLKVIPECQGLIGVFTGVKRVRYTDSVKPGDVLIAESTIDSYKKIGDSIFGTFSGVGKVNEKIVIEMHASFAALPEEKIK